MSEPIRILHVVGIMNYGGAETLIMNWYRNIDRTKYQFDFLVHTNEEGAYDQEILELGGNIYSVPKFKVWNYFRYKKQIKLHFKQHPEHAIIHGHIRSTASIYAKIAKKFNCKTIVHSHSTSERKGLKRYIKLLLERNITDNSDVLLACSKASGEWLFRDRYFEVLPNVIDCDKFLFHSKIKNETRDKLNLDDENIVIGNVGRYTYEKNHAFLIDLFSKIVSVNDQYRLLLIGKGPLKKQIEELANNKNIHDKIVFIEETNKIESYLMCMDIFLFPSIFEGLGMAAIEAQASGLPTICSDNVPRETELTNIIEYKELNINSWIKTLLSIKRNTRKDRIDNNKLVKVSDFDVVHGVERLTLIYRQLL